MASDVAAGFTRKIERAEEHIQNVNALVATMVTNSDVIFFQPNVQLGNNADRLARQQVRLNLTIGDAVHNLRSALDHLVWELVPEGKGTPDTAFPIWFNDLTPDQHQWRSYVGKKVKGAGKKITKEFRALQPYKGGNDDLLWILHHLDIRDKHRLLLTIVRQHQGRITDGLRMGDSVSYSLNAPTDQGVIAPIRQEEPDDNFELAVDVFLDEPGVAEREPVIPLLAKLSQATTDIVNLFSRFLSV